MTKILAWNFNHMKLSRLHMIIIIAMSLKGTLICIPAIFEIGTTGDLFFRSFFLGIQCLLLAFLHSSYIFREFVICECPVSNTLGLALTFQEIFAKHPIYINFASGLVYIYKVVWSCKICKKEKYSQLGHFGWISGFLCGFLGCLYFFALQALLKIWIFRLAIS